MPNHGLVVLGLLYGEDDFQKSLMITTTAGWDTDCNASAVGCLLGIKNGLACIDAGTDLHGHINDRSERIDKGCAAVYTGVTSE